MGFMLCIIGEDEERVIWNKCMVAQIAPLDLRSKRKVSKKCYLCKEVNQRREVNYK